MTRTTHPLRTELIATACQLHIMPPDRVTGLITERGTCAASADGLRSLFPEHAPGAACPP